MLESENNTVLILKTIISAIEDKKGENIVVLELKELSPIADYFVICDGITRVHLNTIYESILEKLKIKHNISPSHIEGNNKSEWILIDLGEIIVHIFSPKKRAFYNLEGLWWEAKNINFESGQPDSSSSLVYE